MRIAPGASSGTTSGPSGHGSAMDRKGPTVCDGVRPSVSVIVGLGLERRAVLTAQHDVELECEGPRLDGLGVVVATDHALARPLVAHRVVDRVLEEQRV